MEFYVDYLDSKNKFRPKRKYFNSYEDARDWCIETMDKFDPDYIKTV
jgi:hypothetical protein